MCNSKGISVLFLVIAMLLMVSIGYVFSYLIPTKQKSAVFPIYSTQAFFIAQSGVEFAIRYASDQGWRGTTDGGIFDLNRLNGTSRPLGNGTFTLAYDQPTNTLTSTGQITGLSQNRVAQVSNFSPFLRLIFDPVSSVPCWSRLTDRIHFYLKNVRSTDVTLTAFSASWTETGAARQIARIYLGGNEKYRGNYNSGSGTVNFNRGGNSQTISTGTVYEVEIRFNNDLTNGANFIITFYTAAGDGYTFNLDAQGDGLPTC